MHPPSSRWLALLGLAILAVSGGQAQEPTPALAERSPRFFLADSRTKQAVPVDVRRTRVLSQRISVDFDGVTLKEALAEISRVAQLPLIYSKDNVPLHTIVRLRAEHITVAGALSEVLLDANVDVLLSADGRAAIVTRGRSTAGRRADTLAVVTGRVTVRETGAPVVGANVIVTAGRTKLTAVTRDNGEFAVSEVPRGEWQISMRYIGYKQLIKTVVVEADTVQVDFAVEPIAVALEELVTTATGQQRRRDLGNAITTIRADSVLRSAPIRSLTDLLENRVPGMSVQHTSGAPGDPARLRLRGLGSVMRGNDPVVIVDGVRVYAAQSEARSGNLTNLSPEPGNNSLIDRRNTPAPSPLDQIDPNMIEKIEVFKGPSAATLYGADAANGVIVVTTKRGKPGPTRWTASLTSGWTTPAGRYPEGYYSWGHSVLNGGVTEFCPLVNLGCVRDSLVRYQALNDPDMTIFGVGRRTALTATASGGSQALTYSVTASYADESGLLTLPGFEVERFRTRFNREPPDWMRRPHHLESWSVSSNVTARVGRTADVTLSTTVSRSEQQRTALERQQSALATTYVDKVNGLYYPVPRSGRLIAYPAVSGVLSDYYQRTIASTITVTTGLNAQWRPTSWFDASSQAGLNVVPRDDETLRPAGLVEAADSGMLARGTGRSLAGTFNLQGTVRRPIGLGFVFQTSVGANLATTTTNDLITSALGLASGTSSLVGANRFYAMDARVATSVFGWYIEPRITGQRLSLSTGVRLDGGSAYGTRVTGLGSGGSFLRGLLALPKLNGSWVVSEEPWFPFKSLFSSLRLRGAYGQAQVQPGALDRLRIYNRRTDGSGELLDLDQLGNAELRPERSTEFEGGFDVDVLDSRVSVELTAYRKLQVDALMPVSLPISVNGGGTIIRNIGNIRNTGVELTARVIPVQSRFLTWSAELNFNSNRNTLVKLGPGVEPNPEQGVVAGYPVSSRWSRPILGFADRNDDGVITAGEVRVGDSLVFMGRLLPAYESSLFTNVALFGGAIGVTAGFSYDAGATQINDTARTNWVLHRAHVDPSTPPNQQAAVVVNNQTSYGLTQTVSTFRFNSFAVNYRFPEQAARLLRAQSLSLAIQGNNLGLRSTYRGKDPDVTAWSPTEHVADTGQLAIPRTWQFAFFLQY